MNQKKIAIFVVIIMVFIPLAIGIAAEPALRNNVKNPQFFDAEITFYVQTGEGCACDPIEGALVQAFGGEGNASAVTDEDGMCVLTLVIDGEYEVIIEADGLLDVYYEFNVVDDQTFIIHMFEKPESTTNTASLFRTLISKVLLG